MKPQVSLFLFCFIVGAYGNFAPPSYGVAPDSTLTEETAFNYAQGQDNTTSDELHIEMLNSTKKPEATTSSMKINETFSTTTEKTKTTTAEATKTSADKSPTTPKTVATTPTPTHETEKHHPENVSQVSGIPAASSAKIVSNDSRLLFPVCLLLTKFIMNFT